jgi:HSP20 family molecular chaperone IbpA
MGARQLTFLSTEDLRFMPRDGGAATDFFIVGGPDMMTLRFSPLNELRDEMDRMRNQVEHFFGAARSRPSLDPSGFPALNAWEDADHFYVEAELPGLALEDLDISLTDTDALTIKGQRKEPALQTGSWHRRERAVVARRRRCGERRSKPEAWRADDQAAEGAGAEAAQDRSQSWLGRRASY